MQSFVVVCVGRRKHLLEIKCLRFFGVFRAVRFVTFPQLLERIIAIDTEVLQLDDALRQEFEDGYSDLVKVRFYFVVKVDRDESHSSVDFC